jgi:hypothetical protein
MKPLAIAAMFVPLAPFLVIDAVQGFPNIAEIAQKPRFHSLYPNKPFGNAGLLTLVFGWMQEVAGALSGVLSILTLAMFGLGLAIGIGAIARTGRGGVSPALAAAVLFCIPAFELTVLGMGYNSRHTLAMVPALFILAGFGFAGAVNVVWPMRAEFGALLIVPLIAILGLHATNSAVMEKVSRSEGEWAIDYASREAIAKDLILRLGMPPDVYAARTFWWWVGWSIDPEIYADIYRHVAPAPKSLLTADQYVLVTETAELPPILKSVFDDVESRPVAGMFVRVATPKATVASPSANADTGVRLNRFLEQVDQLRDRTQGFARIGHEQTGTGSRDLFLSTMADGRIKLLVTIEQSEAQSRGRLRWCVDSPTLNGHYQEIKTVWRPRLVLAPASGAPVEASLASDVLGSLPYKTPRCGEAWSERSGPWRVTFASDGVFDQSFMPRPDLSSQRWPLDFDTPILNTSLSQEAISEWIKRRFGR